MAQEEGDPGEVGRGGSGDACRRSTSPRSSPLATLSLLTHLYAPNQDTCPEDLLVAVFKAAVERAKIDINLVEEIQVGNVLPPGGGASVARMAQLAGE